MDECVWRRPGGLCSRSCALVLALLSQGLWTMPAFPQGGGADWPVDIRRDTFEYSDRSPTEVPWRRIVQGCGRRDCIPSIDQPVFARDGAYGALDGEELVMGIRGEAATRAYPVRILNYHEVVNDWLGDVPIVITYCPLCGSGLAFRRDLPSGVTTFGVSGLLHESDLILYDRASQSLWQQATGRAFAGPRRGDALVEIEMTLTTWSEWRAAHPETVVLQAPDPDHPRYRTATPYGDYDRSGRLMFPVSRRNRALPTKAVVFGFPLGAGVAVSETLLRERRCVRFEHAGATAQIRRHDDGAVTLEGPEPAVIARRMFWFAWFTFNPETLLLDQRIADLQSCAKDTVRDAENAPP